ncbi:MAG: hypothetical protein ACE5G0_12345 [Rhodothermales bacterium]
MIPDQETIYQLIYERQWAALLDVVHRQHDSLAGDALLTRAVETFVTTFFDHLSDGPPGAFAGELEKWFLLHTGGFYALPDARFEQVVEALVALHADRPEVAVGYARFYPENERCAAVLHRHAPPEPVPHTQEATLDLAVRPPLTDVDARISLFKSQQEIDFFLAVREVYATYFVYPNVALSCLVDYERIKEHLAPEARQYFFRGIVDCVVFDQHGGYRPVYFFELDSTLHDTEARQANDRHKERILALAGQTLHRIRRREATAGRAAFVALLKELAETTREEPVGDEAGG